ncbi:hypothetical protein KAM352_39270 [Aeromonas caviae]|nr:hypothetical protein KAM352_39270 [Aeromonas caviae]
MSKVVKMEIREQRSFLRSLPVVVKLGKRSIEARRVRENKAGTNLTKLGELSKQVSSQRQNPLTTILGNRQVSSSRVEIDV